MHRTFHPSFVLGFLVIASAAPLRAMPVLHAKDAWYSGSVAAAHREDLDVQSADGIYEDGVGWHLTATMYANIDPTLPSSYVWGFGRGSTATVALFAGEPDVQFDSILALSPSAGTAAVRQLDTSVVNNLVPAQFSWSGATLNAFIPEAYLPTVAGGFSDDAFTWNLWPRIPGGPSSNIADFVPENAMQPFSTVPAGAVPEPGSLGLVVSGLPLAGILLRRRIA